MTRSKTSAVPPPPEDALSRLFRMANDEMESFAAGIKDVQPADPPLTIHSTRNEFRLEIKLPEIRAASI